MSVTTPRPWPTLPRRGQSRGKPRRLARFGTAEAIRRRVLAGAGVAVLPECMIRVDLAARRVRVLFPKIRPVEDYFRFVFRADDARRPMFEALARSMRGVPLG